MISEVYAKKEGILSELVYRHTSDAVYIECAGKVIVLSPDAFVMDNQGMFILVRDLQVGANLQNVGRVRKIGIVRDKRMFKSVLHKSYTVNSYVCALWLRGLDG